MTIVFVSCANRKIIYGKYCQCPFFCECVTLFPDSTFEYHIYGDLFGNQKTYGTWEEYDRKRILANSNEQPPSANDYKPIKIYNASIEEGIEIKVVDDQSGIALPGANIILFVGTDSLGCSGVITNDNGIAILTQNDIWKILITYIGYEDREYYFTSKNNSGIEISLIDNWRNRIYITNEKWEIGDSCIYLDKHRKLEFKQIFNDSLKAL